MTHDRPEMHFIQNGAGWRLALRRVRPPSPRDGAPSPPPLLIVPGYGMNSFIFSFHPHGLSLEAYLASQGIEVWSVDLRGQGRAQRIDGTFDYGLAELAVDDLRAAISYVLAKTETGRDTLHLVGCSLGAALIFGYLASVNEPRVAGVVSMGGLVTWKKVPPLLRGAMFSPWLVGKLRLKHTRQLCRYALPALARVAPKALSIYLNTSSTDVSSAATMVQTVEDPHPGVNQEIARWVRRGDLILRGVNVSRALRSMRYPLLSIVARHDGIVPIETASVMHEEMASDDRTLLVVGDDERRVAHADLFLATFAHELIFAPLARWILDRG